jgi:SAM-dependent methyltransferase
MPGWPRSGGCWLTRSCGTAASSLNASAPSSPTSSKAAGYDAEAGGGLFAEDEPVVARYLSGREPGMALDAASGTGRFAEFLSRCGHRVTGVDSSPDMLAYARRRVPNGRTGPGR